MSLISGQRSRVSVKTPSLPASAAASKGSRDVKDKTYAERKATALAAKNTAVLSYDELERIKGMCS